MMGLGMLMFWGLVVAAVVVVLRGVGHPRDHTCPPTPAPTPGTPTALQLLDERYARGELTEEDYRHHRDVLAGR
jgi:putative membrane protein